LAEVFVAEFCKLSPDYNPVPFSPNAALIGIGVVVALVGGQGESGHSPFCIREISEFRLLSETADESSFV